MEGGPAGRRRRLLEGTAGGGLVTVSMNGKGEMKGLRIDPSLFKEDEVEVLEDLILAAIKDAQARAARLTADEMARLTESFGIPPGMKLPF